MKSGTPKKIALLVAGLFTCLALIGYVNLRELKELFIASPLARIYITKFRDGPSIDKDHLLTTLDNGMQIIVNKHDRCVCWFVRLTGHWDSNETKVLDRLVKKGFNVVEVGSNFGVHTLRMADSVGKGGKIYAFEANPHVSKYLKQSVALNKLGSRLQVFDRAVAQESYDGFMVYGLANIGGGYILPNTPTTKETCKKSECTPIRVTTLDTALSPNKRIDLLKIDAEGSEFWILQGATALLRQPDIVLMMEHDIRHLQRNNVDLHQFIKFLKENGFLYVWSIEKGGVLRPISYEDLMLDIPRDIVLAKKNKIDIK